MTVRGKLIALLSAFAVFAVVTASLTIIGIQFQVERAVQRFDEVSQQQGQFTRLDLAMREQAVELRDLIDGRTGDASRFITARDRFAIALNSLRFTDAGDRAEIIGQLRTLGQQVQDTSFRCYQHLQENDTSAAREVLVDELESGLIPDIHQLLVSAKQQFSTSSSQAGKAIGATSSQVLLLTALIAAIAAGLVVIEAAFIRRWLMVPILALHEAARRFREGDFAYRIRPRSNDELGRLGEAMNEMADSVAAAQAGLQASEKKYRSLFRNLRDAVVIVDRDGVIVEYHDSSQELLDVAEAEHAGKPLLDIWPTWQAASDDWPTVIRDVVELGKRLRAVDIAVSSGDAHTEARFADFLVYRVQYGGVRFAAIVIRDVTKAHRLQRKLVRAETMEAVGTLAGGLAHDFNNLLSSVTGTLSLFVAELPEGEQAERIQRALRACREAAGLSRRLLNFATSAHGSPTTFYAAAIVETIVESMDEAFWDGVKQEKRLDRQATVRMDQDQFTQVVLNLIRNARDAMPEGGRLLIELSRTTAVDPDESDVERPYTNMVVEDTGCGMSPEVQRRIFEPLFTEKARTTHRGRGLGMSVVYAAVKNAGGFIRIDSTPGEGTTMSVFLPPGSGALPDQPSGDMTSSMQEDDLAE